MSEDETLEDILKSAAKFAAEAFNDQGAISPMWIVETKTGLKVISSDMPERKLKEAFASALRELFAQLEVTRYAFIVEAWCVEAKQMPTSHELGASLASHPDRQEVIQIIAEDKQRCIAAHYVILRPEHGKAKLSELHMFSGESKGVFTKLIN